MTSPIEYLEAEDLMRLAAMALGAEPVVRDLGLLEAAAARPAASVFGVGAYDDLWTKAAALLQSLVKNHALVDGNKRLAWLATAVFLDLNGAPMTGVDNDAVHDFVVWVASGRADVETIATRLRSLVEL